MLNINNVTGSNFEYNYYSSEKHSNSTMSEYVRHTIDVMNVLTYKSIDLQTVYQTGQSFYYGSNQLPMDKLELSLDGGTNKVLYKISELYEADIDNNDLEDDFIESLDCEAIKTIEDVYNIYHALIQNELDANNYLESIDIDLIFEDGY